MNKKNFKKNPADQNSYPIVDKFNSENSNSNPFLWERKQL